MKKQTMKNIILAAFAAVTLAAAPAWATGPKSYMDACVGGPGEIHLQGWTYDPDTPSESINIAVDVYCDENLQRQYGEPRVFTANVPRPDVNSAFNISGNHGFSVDIPIADPGTYWVITYAVDPTSPMPIGTLTQVTVTASNYLTLTEDASEPVGTAARWYVNMASNGTNRVRLPDVGTVAFKVYDCGGKTGVYKADDGARDGTLTLIAPAGYAFELSGLVEMSGFATLTVYDGGDDTAARLFDGRTGRNYWTSIGTVVGSGPNMTLRFSDPDPVDATWSYGGLDLTVKLVRLGGTHAVIVNNPAAGGTVASSPAAAPYRGTVTLTATPSSGCLFAGVSVVDGAGDAVDVDWLPWSNVATFSMPAALSATVTPMFFDDLTAAGGLYIDMPATGTISVAIPAGVQSFKVYDDGGKDGNYRHYNPFAQTLVLTAPAGYVLQLSGSIKSANAFLNVYDGGDDTAAKLIDGASSRIGSIWSGIGPVASSGPSMTLFLRTPAYTYNVAADLDLTVTLVAADVERPIYGLGEVAGGSVAASVSGVPATQARVNDVVTLTAAPSEGRMLGAISVVDGDGDTVPVSWEGPFHNTATFVMLGSAATVAPVFTDSLTADGGLWVNMPATGTNSLAIPAGVQSFKVYDDGGKDGGYSNNCNGTLVLTAPKGHVLRLSGRVRTEYGADKLTVYDGGDDTAAKLIDGATTGQSVTGWKHIGPVTGTVGSMALHFKSGLSYAIDDYGLDLTVEVIECYSADTTAYKAWAAANNISGAWNETDALGIHNVFRYVFDKPVGAFADPPLLDIEIEGGNAVVKTPPVANTAGFAVTVVESSDVAGVTVTRRLSPDATGRVEFPMEGAASRFYRLSATPNSELGGVQLWEGGPYWAECNVGAAKPEDYGYYFWWGDTVGYTNTGSGWISVKDGTGISFDASGVTASTYDKDNSTLQSEGWIDATTNLVAAHDAATAHLGAPWRMPTDEEMEDLITKCTFTWMTRNGVYGKLVTGKGAYADRSIFFPATGYGDDSNFYLPGSQGNFWSSSTYSNLISSWGLFVSSDFYARSTNRRYSGQSVRPVRTAD